MSDAAVSEMTAPPQLPLRRRVLRASAWAITGHAGAQLIRFASSLVMTRMLVPEMFGVMAIAFVFMTGLTLLSDLGLSQNVIQSRRGNSPVFLNTVWSVQVLRGAGVFAVALMVAMTLYLASGLLPSGTAYAEPILPPVLAVLAFTAVITAFESTRLSFARRNLDQAWLVRIDLVSTVASLLAMVAWASVDRSVWALVAGAYASTLVRTLLSHVVLAGHPDRFGWDRDSLVEIRSFGKWIVVSSLLGFIVLQGDRILIGGLVDAQTLGVYAIAVTLAGVLDALINKLVSDITLPALSEVARDQRDRLATTFYSFHLILGGGALFVTGALMASGPVWVDLLYDARYRDPGWMLGILAVTSATTPSRIATQACLAIRKSRPVGILMLVRLPLLYLLTPLAFHLFGLVGALWAVALGALSNVPVAWWFQYREGVFDLRREVAIWLALPLGWMAGFGVSSLYFGLRAPL